MHFCRDYFYSDLDLSGMVYRVVFFAWLLHRLVAWIKDGCLYSRLSFHRPRLMPLHVASSQLGTATAAILANAEQAAGSGDCEIRSAEIKAANK
jgi:hypothetical protein